MAARFKACRLEHIHLRQGGSSRIRGKPESVVLRDAVVETGSDPKECYVRLREFKRDFADPAKVGAKATATPLR